MGRVLQLLSLLVGLVSVATSEGCGLSKLSQALFASVLPEILELLGAQSKWAGTYHCPKGKR